MLSSSFAGSSSGHGGQSTTKRKCSYSGHGEDSRFHDAGSIAKRRRTPANSEALSSIATTAPIAIPLPAASNGLFSFQHAQDAVLHHPLPQQPAQRLPLCQLITPPIEAHQGFNYTAPVSRPYYMHEDEMMLDDNVSMSQGHMLENINGFGIPQYRPPSPLTPLLSNPKPLGPFGRTHAPAPTDSTGNSPYAMEDDADLDDPMADLWSGSSRSANKGKNLDGEVIGYKMGFLADCVKCQKKIPGHSGHFIRKNHSV